MTKNTRLNRLETLRQNNQEMNNLTRESIELAFLDLLKKQSFSEITITDIVKRAGVSRASYYRNYQSKEDILNSFVEVVSKQISKSLQKYDPIKETKKSWLELLTGIEKVAPQYKLLLDVGWGERIANIYAKLMNLHIRESEIETYYSNIYWAGAISLVIGEWIKKGLKTPKEQIADIASNLMINGIRTIKNYKNQCIEDN